MEIQWATLEDTYFDEDYNTRGIVELSDRGIVTIMDDTLVKFDGHGDFEWAIYINQSLSSSQYLHAYPDGGFAVIGNNSSTAGYLLKIMRMDNDGNIVWQRECNYWGPFLDTYRPSDVFMGSGNVLHIAGNIANAWPIDDRIEEYPFLVAFDEYGDTLFTKLVTEFPCLPKYSYGYYAIAETSAKEIVMISNQFNLFSHEATCRFFQFDSFGQLTGSVHLPEIDNQYHDLIRLNNDNYVTIGGSYSDDELLLCFNSEFQYIGHYQWPGNSIISNPRLFPHGNGFITIGHILDGFWLSYINTLIPVANDDFVLPFEKNLTVSPNPFNPSTTIEFSLTKPILTELFVYNIKGQLVKTLINQRLQSGIHKVNWDGKDDFNNLCASGIYFFKIKYNNKTVVQKATLLK
ncbi:MAG: T9SS type A sorting domain-containing protein [Candidatus Cloacimonetes bacterium]|nr:T9SS type A sorting domain-containing protein [Candidatus Cloacimonadota bacterium]